MDGKATYQALGAIEFLGRAGQAFTRYRIMKLSDIRTIKKKAKAYAKFSGLRNELS